jgi:hypothetical protein
MLVARHITTDTGYLASFRLLSNHIPFTSVTLGP